MRIHQYSHRLLPLHFTQATCLWRTDPSENVSYLACSSRDKQLIKGLRLLPTSQYFQKWNLYRDSLTSIGSCFLFWLSTFSSLYEEGICSQAFLCGADVEMLCHRFQGLDRLKPCLNCLVEKRQLQAPSFGNVQPIWRAGFQSLITFTEMYQCVSAQGNTSGHNLGSWPQFSQNPRSTLRG